MVKVYAVAVAVGVLALVYWLFSATLADNAGRAAWDPATRWGNRGKIAIGAVIGFGMGGLSAEFAPIELAWPVALLIAVVAALLSIYWVRYAVGQSEAR
jgi:hypothetical protein